MTHIDDVSSVTPDGPQSKTDLGWLADLDPSLTDEAFEQARINAQFAQTDFATYKDRFGAAVVLADYKRRVLRWLEDVDNFYLSRILYVLAMVLDGTTHSQRISVNGRIGAGTKDQRGEIAPGSLLDKYRKTYGETISYPTFHKYLKLAIDEYKLVERDGPGFGGAKRRSKGRKHAGAYDATTYHVNFWRTLKDGKVIPHDFYAPLPPLPDDDRNTGLDTGRNTGLDTSSFDLVVGSCGSTGGVAPPGETARLNTNGDDDMIKSDADYEAEVSQENESRRSRLRRSRSRQRQSRSGLSRAEIADLKARGIEIPGLSDDASDSG